MLTTTSPQIAERFGAAIAAAVVITAALFWIMQSAIEQNDITIGDPPIGDLLPNVRLDRDEEILTKPDKKPPPPPEVKPQPPRPDVIIADGNGVEIGSKFEPPKGGIGPLKIHSADGDPFTDRNGCA